MLVTKSWKATDLQWEALLSGYLPLHCIEKHYDGIYEVSEQRNVLKIGSRFCRPVYCALLNSSGKLLHRCLISLPCVSWSYCSVSVTFPHLLAWCQLLVSLWHFIYVGLWNMETNSGCCVPLSCGFSWDCIVSARFHSEGNTDGCAAFGLALKVCALLCCSAVMV